MMVKATDVPNCMTALLLGERGKTWLAITQLGVLLISLGLGKGWLTAAVF